MQLDGKWYIAVINKLPDEVSKTLGSSFSLAQVQFLKTVVRSTHLLCNVPCLLCMALNSGELKIGICACLIVDYFICEDLP